MTNEVMVAALTEIIDRLTGIEDKQDKIDDTQQEILTRLDDIVYPPEAWDKEIAS